MTEINSTVINIIVNSDSVDPASNVSVTTARMICQTQVRSSTCIHMSKVLAFITHEEKY
jgi:hypothetical protein